MRRHLVIGAVLTGWLVVSATGVEAQLTHVPTANPKVPGVVQPNVLSPELTEVIRAEGAMLLENPVSPAKYYGYNDDKPNLMPLPPPALLKDEAHEDGARQEHLPRARTGQRGADPTYDYGRHFLFQGHESGRASRPAGLHHAHQPRR